MPEERAEIVVLELFPVNAPGLMVQFPEGRPVSITLPVATEHVGCVIVPAAGAPGLEGCEFIIISPVAAEVHPEELVTVKFYVPGKRFEIVVPGVFPLTETGLMVQFPDGSPLRSILPVEIVHEG